MDLQRLFKNFKKEVECPLCIETANNPKTLPCLHSFCLECLDELAGFARRQLQTTIKCPVCQTSFHIPEGGSFINLPTSFRLNRLVDLLALKDGSEQAQKCSSCDENMVTYYCFVCQNVLCKACFEAHQRLKATRGHRNVLIEKLQAQDVEELIQRPVTCQQQYHENQPLEFFCEECKVPICQKCSVVSHSRHTITDTQKAAQIRKMQIAEALEKVKAKVVSCRNKMKIQTDLMTKTKSEILCAEKKMADAVEHFTYNLRKHEKDTKGKFRVIHEVQQKHHTTQLETMEVLATQLKSCVEQGESILQRNSSAEILQTNQPILRRCEELLNTRKPESFKSPHVYYVLVNKENILDRIVVSNTDPLMSSAEGQSLEKEMREKKENEFTIVTRDSDGLQYYEEHDQIKVGILSPAGDQLKTEIKDTKDGKYTVTYTPQCAGQHTVEIQVNGQPLTGSPWVVQVVPHRYQFVFQFGSTGKEQGEFINPMDVAVSEKTGTVAVADVNNGRIQMFSSDGSFLREIRLRQQQPASVAFTESGDLIICIRDEDKKLWLLSEEGQFIRYIRDEHLEVPFHISVAGDGRIITCDWADKNIKVLSADGKDLLQSFTAPDCDSNPWRVAYHYNMFFVSYPDANCVKVFNSAGVYLYDIGCEGSGDGQLHEPIGLVIDNFNHLTVCDAKNKRLQLFTLDGKFVAEMKGSYFDNDCYPFSAGVSNMGHLFVSDCRKNCIYVFQKNC